MSEPQSVALAIGALITALGSLGGAVKVMATQRKMNGNGSRELWQSLSAVSERSSVNAEAISSIKVSLRRIEDKIDAMMETR